MFDYSVLPAEDQVFRTAEAVRARGLQVEIVETGVDAFEKLKQLIPDGASVMTGASQTLLQIGFEDLLISKAHPWINLKDALLAEQDMERQQLLRRQSSFADYYVGSVQAIAETGELVFASATGSQLGAYAYTSPNLIWVAGVQKIVPTLNQAIERVREYCFALEDARQKERGFPGSLLAKLLILEQEVAFNQRNATLILVSEPLGY